jgi:hypothetical protein
VTVERSLFTTETRLFGRVVDAASGAGIAGAGVRVVDGAGISQSFTTQSDGSYFFNLAPGAFTGSVVAAEFSEATLSGTLPAQNDSVMHDARLTRTPRAFASELTRGASGPTLTGRVLDAQTQGVISRADVSATVGGQAEQGFSNIHGIYLLPVTTGALSGAIAASGYTGATLSGTTGAGHTRMSDALLTTSGPAVAVSSAGFVPTAAVVIGHVTDSQTGAGVGGALVTIVVNGQTLIGVTDTNGDFRFEVGPGSVTGTIVATGYGSSTFNVTVAAGDTVNVNIASNAADRAARADERGRDPGAAGGHGDGLGEGDGGGHRAAAELGGDGERDRGERRGQPLHGEARRSRDGCEHDHGDGDERGEPGGREDDRSGALDHARARGDDLLTAGGGDGAGEWARD